MMKDQTSSCDPSWSIPQQSTINLHFSPMLLFVPAMLCGLFPRGGRYFLKLSTLAERKPLEKIRAKSPRSG